MLQRGRKSSAALAITTLAEARPSAPEGLTSEQVAVWKDTVTRLPADWFPREQHALLAEYCRAVTQARFIGAEIDEFKREWMGEPGGVERYAKLVATADKCVRSMTALARALRITNQSRFKPEKAARQARGFYDGPMPWE
jgi:phage terminase small subunit